MSSISTIALSGMTAATRRLAVSASNVANIASTGTLPDASGAVAAGAPRAYAPLVVVETASAGGGTATSVATATPLPPRSPIRRPPSPTQAVWLPHPMSTCRRR